MRPCGSRAKSEFIARRQDQVVGQPLTLAVFSPSLLTKALEHSCQFVKTTRISSCSARLEEFEGEFQCQLSCRCNFLSGSPKNYYLPFLYDWCIRASCASCVVAPKRQISRRKESQLKNVGGTIIIILLLSFRLSDPLAQREIWFFLVPCLDGGIVATISSYGAQPRASSLRSHCAIISQPLTIVKSPAENQHWKRRTRLTRRVLFIQKLTWGRLFRQRIVMPTLIPPRCSPFYTAISLPMANEKNGETTTVDFHT